MWRTKRPIREGSFLLKEREQPFYEFHVAYSFTGLYRRQSRSNGAHTARFGHPRAISVTIFAHNGFAFVAKIKSQDSADISPKQPSLARASLPLARSADADAVRAV